MNEIREHNLNAIKKNIKAYPLNFLDLLDSSKKEDDISLEVIETKSKNLSAKVIKNGKSVLLHSAYDPVKEANTLIKEIEDDVDVVFIFTILLTLYLPYSCLFILLLIHFSSVIILILYTHLMPFFPAPG